MKILIKQARILDRNSEYHGTQQDLLIQDGEISEIGQIGEIADAVLIERPGLCVSLGWTDLKADFCDPGHEYKETIQGGLQAAAFGGFTHVQTVPTTMPPIDGKTQVEYLLSRASQEVCQLHPAGAISVRCKGEELAELYDMSQSGVRFFTDDDHPVSAGLAHRALLYSRNLGARIMLFNSDPSLAHGAQVNEGEASVRTGLKGDPFISELIQIDRNLRLLEYSESALHLTGISSAEALPLIEQAKSKGLNVTADVHVEQLLFNEEAVFEFDHHYKLKPVLRREEDRLALIEGVKKGTIDSIVSNHRPSDQEDKLVAFDDVKPGNITLQLMYSAVQTNQILSTEEWLEVVAGRNRQLLLGERGEIKKGMVADLSLFCPDEKWIPDQQNLRSSYPCTPYCGKEMKGKVVGVINNRKLALVE
ncbi:MAG: dihydroorotase [Bacteroidetes bacterium]|nr:MAG: dihydroorotase [Bacteroidota bacterium]